LTGRPRKPCAGVLILHGFIAHKIPSDSPEAYGDAAVQGIRDLSASNRTSRFLPADRPGENGHAPRHPAPCARGSSLQDEPMPASEGSLVLRRLDNTKLITIDHVLASSWRTILAPSTIAHIFSKAMSRGRYFRPQSGATMRRSAGTCGSARRMRAATVSGVSTLMSERSSTPRMMILPEQLLEHRAIEVGLRRFDRDLPDWRCGRPAQARPGCCLGRRKSF
jgi:hypothetical protein